MNLNRCLRGVAVFLGVVIVLSALAMPGYSYQRVIFDAYTLIGFDDSAYILGALQEVNTPEDKEPISRL